MAQKLITYENLQSYDTLIKNYISTEQGKDIKTVLFDSTNKQIKFYKKENATLADTAAYTIDIPANLDGSAAIASASNGVVTLKGGVLEQDGIVSNAPSTAQATVVEGYLYEGQWYEEDTHTTPITLETTKSYKDLTTNKVYNWDGTNLIEVLADITLAKVATTGTAADVAIVDAGSLITATDVEGALQELASAAAGGVESKTVWLKTDETITTGYLKTYGLYQGANSPDHATAPATLIGKIDIPKDLVVTQGKVVTVENGVDSDGESTSVADGTYLKLTIANQVEKVYINVEDLADVYTANNQTSEITITIDNTNNITALAAKIPATKSIYKNASAAVYTQVEAGDTFDENETYYTEDAGVYTVDSTVNAENFDTKVAAGLYIETTPAVAEQSVKAKLDELDYEVATASDINHLFD